MDRREILQQVASGDLSPQDAASLLEALDAEPPVPRVSVATGTLKKVRVIGDFRTAKIVGDPDVSEAVVDGPHSASREGDTLVINAESGEHDAGEWTFRRGPRARISIGLGSRPKPVSIRMNPDLALEVRIDAGSASINGVHGPINGEIDAGLFRIEDFASPFDLSVDAGSITASGLLDRGESRIRCDAGNVKVTLRDGSSVRVRAQADVGHVAVGSSNASGLHIGGGEKEHVFGDGAGTLDIRGGIGRIKVEQG